MMVLSGVTVGSGYADFLKGEGQKGLHAGVCKQMCARERFPHVCVCGASAHGPHAWAVRELVTVSSKVSSSISHQSGVGLKTPDSISFTPLWSLNHSNSLTFFAGIQPGQHGGSAVSTVTSQQEGPASVGNFAWIPPPPTLFQRHSSQVDFESRVFPLGKNVSVTGSQGVCGGPIPHRLVYIAWGARCVYSSSRAREPG